MGGGTGRLFGLVSPNTGQHAQLLGDLRPFPVERS